MIKTQCTLALEQVNCEYLLKTLPCMFFFLLRGSTFVIYLALLSMNIDREQLHAAAARAQQLPRPILKPRPLDYIPERKRSTSAQHFARRTAFLSEGGARPSPTELERIMGSNDLVDEFYFDRALLAAMPVCRII